MQMFKRLIAVLLTLTFAGVANACVAACARPMPITVAATEPAHCRHCTTTPTEKPASQIPSVPCKYCQGAVQDRLPTDGNAAFTCNVDLWGTTCIDGDAGIALAIPFLPSLQPLTHGPPGERLHQFCVLLI